MAALSQRQLSKLRDRVTRVRLDRETERAKADKAAFVRVPTRTAVRYATPEESRAARKRANRESKKRPCPGCGGTKSAARPGLCQKCYTASREPAHGTVSRYSSRRYLCRCGLCSAASTEYHRNRRAALRDWKQAA